MSSGVIQSLSLKEPVRIKGGGIEQEEEGKIEKVSEEDRGREGGRRGM